MDNSSLAYGLLSCIRPAKKKTAKQLFGFEKQEKFNQEIDYLSRYQTKIKIHVKKTLMILFAIVMYGVASAQTHKNEKNLHCTPFLLFDGNCAEAMTFYQKCLGGELTLTKLGDTPMKAQFPPEKHNRIINAQLKSGAVDFSATDWMASPTLEPKQGNTFSIFVTGGTYDELNIVFKKLSEGADKDKRTFIELHNMPFGSLGQFTDKFGVSWIFKGDKKE